VVVAGMELIYLLELQEILVVQVVAVAHTLVAALQHLVRVLLAVAVVKAVHFNLAVVVDLVL
jgi:hypothetical protein